MPPLNQINFDFENEVKKEVVMEKTEPSTNFLAGLKPKETRGRKSLKEVTAMVDLIEVPDDDVLFQKQYYSISEVAKWFRVKASLLRFWENEFDILKPRKNRKGDRYFRPEDVRNLKLIYFLLRQRKYTIEGAKDYLKKNQGLEEQKLEMIESLQNVRSFILELKAQL